MYSHIFILWCLIKRRETFSLYKYSVPVNNLLLYISSYATVVNQSFSMSPCYESSRQCTDRCFLFSASVASSVIQIFIIIEKADQELKTNELAFLPARVI
jgi:hypothetical protein